MREPHTGLLGDDRIPASRLFTTAQAAAYCAFKTAGAIRKLVHDGRLIPVSRRGGRGTLLFSVEELDAFLRGGRPVPSEADRQVAPQLNEAPHDQSRKTEENEIQKRVRHPNRRSLRTSPGHRPDHGQARLHQEDTANQGSTRGIPMAAGGSRPSPKRHALTPESEAALRRIRGAASGR